MEQETKNASVSLPLWEALPDLDLYMDQVLQLTDKHLTPLGIKPVTAAMINNYVKLKLLPSPVSKKYTRVHVAFIFTIALLKDVFEISQIREGILYETQTLGLKQAYNLFVSEVENAVRMVELQGQQTQPMALMEGQLTDQNRILKLAALCFATQRYTKALINQFQGEKKHD